MNNLNYLCPDSMDELKTILKKKDSKAFFIAGGTDLLVKMRHDLLDINTVINIKKIKDFSKIAVTKTQISIGSTVTLSEIAQNKDIIKHFPALAKGALSIGSTQIRNRGTLAGNLCNSSPVADTVPALLIYNAKIQIMSDKNTNNVDIHDFITGVGKNLLKQNELVEKIILPIETDHRSDFMKNARRKALDLSTVNIAAGIFKGEVRLAIGACAPVVKRETAIEEFLKNNKINKENLKKASEMLSIKPISDLRGSKDHRNKIAKRLFVKLLSEMEGIK